MHLHFNPQPVASQEFCGSKNKMPNPSMSFLRKILNMGRSQILLKRNKERDVTPEHCSSLDIKIHQDPLDDMSFTQEHPLDDMPLT